MSADEAVQPHLRLLGSWRRRLALLGLLALIALAGFSAIGGGGVLADIAFFAFAAATVLAWVEVRSRRRGTCLEVPLTTSESLSGGAIRRKSTVAVWEIRVAPVAAALVAVGAVQTWFTGGTAIAGGDLAPPNGTAWLGHIFAPWVWSGSDLGRPSNLETTLPWGALLWLVHGAGGSSAVAERVWFSLLYAAASLGAYALLRQLRLGPVAAFCGAVIYIFNPYVVSLVGTNPVSMAALALVPIGASVMLAVASGRWRMSAAVLALLGTVPFLGYAYSNPPLVLAVGFSILGGALLGAMLYGSSGRRRAIYTLAAGVPLVALASLYWTVPSLEELRVVALHHLAATAPWAWTEARSTLANAFWLNTSWTWAYKDFAPYAYLYDRFPLSLLKYGVPVLGFAALTISYEKRGKEEDRRLVVVAAASTLSLAFVLLSTGTNAPGSVVFDALYHLPYGWLLREPDRFLLFAAMGFTVLVAVTIEAAVGTFVARKLLPRGPTLRAAGRVSVSIVVVALVGIAPGYPLALGAVVDGPVGHFPSRHVRMPSYWTAMATYLNATSTPAGNLLVLPPDAFYQMPYRWYYGNDGFIMDMISRHVLDPSSQGYTPAPGTLVREVDLVASSLLSGNYSEASLALRALGTPDVLLRGDVISNFGGGHIDSPRQLANALAHDPAIRLVHRSGPLDLFRLRRPNTTLAGTHAKVPYATVNSISPDLRDLALFKRQRALLDHSPITGVPAVYQLPSLVKWSRVGTHLYAVLHLVPGDTYSVVLPDGKARPGAAIAGVPIRPGVGSTVVGGFGVRVGGSPRAPLAVADLPLGGQAVADGTFQRGPWAKVGDCADRLGAAARPYLHAKVLTSGGPAGRPALRLSASVDAACMATPLSWRGGPVVLQMSTRHVTGSPPAICVWEGGPNTCATLPPLPSSSRWHTYRAIVHPTAGTRTLSLFLYSVSSPSGGETTDEYAQVSARGIASTSLPVIVARPSTPARASAGLPALTTEGASYTSVWNAGPGADRVLVNGVMNGWLAPPGRRVVPHDSLRPIFTAALLGSSMAGVGGALLLGWLIVSAGLKRRRRLAMGIRGDRPT